MNVMYAAELGSTGAALMSWFHQLSAGKSRRPLKSSFKVTAEVVGVGAGDGAGAGAGDGAGVGDGDGEVVAVGVGLAGVDIFLLHAIAIDTHTPSARQHKVRRIIEPRIRGLAQL